ncbi:hypothetical protein HYH03_017197 [Edaphochlamys debaryana]|uniref:Uncharacterized protein n=1 Tax=Edaphochlamys debaryana TaxID=47281 RepID=A0A835XKJ1_9CHLO|nr:hypothetical protein HYH03_017197 [Edaphochlamys debaryana]|eukprot:KAG2483951.1 hypothetical protein HYH03_017197 [Edaphochlamys debaryana]
MHVKHYLAGGGGGAACPASVRGGTAVVVGGGAAVAGVIVDLVVGRGAGRVLHVCEQHCHQLTAKLASALGPSASGRMAAALVPPYYAATASRRAAYAAAAPLRALFWRRHAPKRGRSAAARAALAELAAAGRSACGGAEDPIFRLLVSTGRVELVEGRPTHFEAGALVLAGGRRLPPAELLLYATGFRNAYDFLEPALAERLSGGAGAQGPVGGLGAVQAPGGGGGGGGGAEGPGEWPYLYRHCLPPDMRNLAILGAEVDTPDRCLTSALQAVWLAALLSGALRPPAPAAMHADVAAQEAWRAGGPLPAGPGRPGALMLHARDYHGQLLRDLGLPAWTARGGVGGAMGLACCTSSAAVSSGPSGLLPSPHSPHALAWAAPGAVSDQEGRALFAELFGWAPIECAAAGPGCGDRTSAGALSGPSVPRLLSAVRRAGSASWSFLMTSPPHPHAHRAKSVSAGPAHAPTAATAGPTRSARSATGGGRLGSLTGLRRWMAAHTAGGAGGSATARRQQAGEADSEAEVEARRRAGGIVSLPPSDAFEAGLDAETGTEEEGEEMDDPGPEPTARPRSSGALGVPSGRAATRGGGVSSAECDWDARGSSGRVPGGLSWGRSGQARVPGGPPSGASGSAGRATPLSRVHEGVDGEASGGGTSDVAVSSAPGSPRSPRSPRLPHKARSAGQMLGPERAPRSGPGGLLAGMLGLGLAARSFVVWRGAGSSHAAAADAAADASFSSAAAAATTPRSLSLLLLRNRRTRSERSLAPQSQSGGTAGGGRREAPGASQLGPLRMQRSTPLLPQADTQQGAPGTCTGPCTDSPHSADAGLRRHGTGGLEAAERTSASGASSPACPSSPHAASALAASLASRARQSLGARSRLTQSSRSLTAAAGASMRSLLPFARTSASSNPHSPARLARQALPEHRASDGSCAAASPAPRRSGLGAGRSLRRLLSAAAREGAGSNPGSPRVSLPPASEDASSAPPPAGPTPEDQLVGLQLQHGLAAGDRALLGPGNGGAPSRHLSMSGGQPGGGLAAALPALLPSPLPADPSLGASRSSVTDYTSRTAGAMRSAGAVRMSASGGVAAANAASAATAAVAAARRVSMTASPLLGSGGSRASSSTAFDLVSLSDAAQLAAYAAAAQAEVYFGGPAAPSARAGSASASAAALAALGSRRNSALNLNLAGAQGQAATAAAAAALQAAAAQRLALHALSAGSGGHVTPERLAALAAAYGLGEGSEGAGAGPVDGSPSASSGGLGGRGGRVLIETAPAAMLAAAAAAGVPGRPRKFPSQRSSLDLPRPWPHEPSPGARTASPLSLHGPAAPPPLLPSPPMLASPPVSRLSAGSVVVGSGGLSRPAASRSLPAGASIPSILSTAEGLEGVAEGGAGAEGPQGSSTGACLLDTAGGAISAVLPVRGSTPRDGHGMAEAEGGEADAGMETETEAETTTAGLSTQVLYDALGRPLEGAGAGLGVSTATGTGTGWTEGAGSGGFPSAAVGARPGLAQAQALAGFSLRGRAASAAAPHSTSASPPPAAPASASASAAGQPPDRPPRPRREPSAGPARLMSALAASLPPAAPASGPGRLHSDSSGSGLLGAAGEGCAAAGSELLGCSGGVVAVGAAANTRRAGGGIQLLSCDGMAEVVDGPHRNRTGRGHGGADSGGLTGAGADSGPPQGAPSLLSSSLTGAHVLISPPRCLAAADLGAPGPAGPGPRRVLQPPGEGGGALPVGAVCANDAMPTAALYRSDSEGGSEDEAAPGAGRVAAAQRQGLQPQRSASPLAAAVAAARRRTRSVLKAAAADGVVGPGPGPGPGGHAGVHAGRSGAACPGRPLHALLELSATSRPSPSHASASVGAPSTSRQHRRPSAYSGLGLGQLELLGLGASPAPSAGLAPSPSASGVRRPYSAGVGFVGAALPYPGFAYPHPHAYPHAHAHAALHPGGLSPALLHSFDAGAAMAALAAAASQHAGAWGQLEALAGGGAGTGTGPGEGEGMGTARSSLDLAPPLPPRAVTATGLGGARAVEPAAMLLAGLSRGATGPGMHGPGSGPHSRAASLGLGLAAPGPVGGMGGGAGGVSLSTLDIMADNSGAVAGPASYSSTRGLADDLLSSRSMLGGTRRRSTRQGAARPPSSAQLGESESAALLGPAGGSAGGPGPGVRRAHSLRQASTAGSMLHAPGPSGPASQHGGSSGPGPGAAATPAAAASSALVDALCASAAALIRERRWARGGPGSAGPAELLPTSAVRQADQQAAAEAAEMAAANGGFGAGLGGGGGGVEAEPWAMHVALHPYPKYSLAATEGPAGPSEGHQGPPSAASSHRQSGAQGPALSPLSGARSRPASRTQAQGPSSASLMRASDCSGGPVGGGGSSSLGGGSGGGASLLGTGASHGLSGGSGPGAWQGGEDAGPMRALALAALQGSSPALGFGVQPQQQQPQLASAAAAAAEQQQQQQQQQQQAAAVSAAEAVLRAQRRAQALSATARRPSVLAAERWAGAGREGDEAAGAEGGVNTSGALVRLETSELEAGGEGGVSAEGNCQAERGGEGATSPQALRAPSLRRSLRPAVQFGEALPAPAPALASDSGDLPPAASARPAAGNGPRTAPRSAPRSLQHFLTSSATRPSDLAGRMPLGCDGAPRSGPAPAGAPLSNSLPRDGGDILLQARSCHGPHAFGLGSEAPPHLGQGPASQPRPRSGSSFAPRSNLGPGWAGLAAGASPAAAELLEHAAAAAAAAGGGEAGSDAATAAAWLSQHQQLLAAAAAQQQQYVAQLLLLQGHAAVAAAAAAAAAGGAGAQGRLRAASRHLSLNPADASTLHCIQEEAEAP